MVRSGNRRLLAVSVAGALACLSSFESAACLLMAEHNGPRRWLGRQGGLSVSQRQFPFALMHRI